jgi:hypothetical protein
MKNLSGPSFYRLFDLLVSMTNPGLKRAHWKVDAVDWERQRHSFTGPSHGFGVEIFTLTRQGAHGWVLMVIKEYWWAGEENKALKSLHWSRPLRGRRGDVIAWFRMQEAALERTHAEPRPSASTR